MCGWSFVVFSSFCSVLGFYLEELGEIFAKTFKTVTPEITDFKVIASHLSKISFCFALLSLSDEPEEYQCNSNKAKIFGFLV